MKKHYDMSITGEDYVPIPKDGLRSKQAAANSDAMRPIVSNPIPEDILKATEKMEQFQSEVAERAFAATVLSSAMSAAFRREYLNDKKMVSLKKIPPELRNDNKIYWLRLTEVGILDGFPPQECALAIERLLQAFHAPENYRLLFLVSSDAVKMSVRIGLQSVKLQSLQGDIPDELPDFVNDFAKANWPGLKFEKESDFISPIREVDNLKENKSISNGKIHHKAGIRVLTGIPAPRDEKNNLPATLDKLMSALSGKRWSYLIIANPVASTEINQYIYTCRDFAGRTESVKSFQVGKNLSIAIQKSFSQNYGRSHGTSQNENSKLRGVAAAGIALLPVAAMLCVACPALLPAALASAPALMGISGAIGGTGGLLAGGILSKMVKGQGKQVSNGESYSEAISESISQTLGASFSETIINKHAEAATKIIEAQEKRFVLSEAMGAWDVGTYFIGENEQTAETGANVLKSLFSGENSYFEPIRIYNPKPVNGLFSMDCDPLEMLCKFDNPCFELALDGEIIAHPLGERYNYLRTVLNTREMLHLVNFPMSNVPGIPFRTISPDTGLKFDKTGNDLELGQQIYRGTLLKNAPYYLDMNSLSKHVLISGINGSGKTNTIKTILAGIGAKKVPFLVIEPAKLEYVDWAIQSNQELLQKYHGKEEDARQDQSWINVYIPGRKTWRGQKLDTLFLNPFDFVWLNPEEEPKTQEHVDRLTTIINAALPMQEILPVLMEELIYMVYRQPRTPEKGLYPCWLPSAPNHRFPTFAEKRKTYIPSFVSMSAAIDSLFKSRKYAEEVSRNLQAALETRVESFKRGWKRELLNKDIPGKSKEDWMSLFERPTIINLTSLTNDEDKAFFMAVIFLFLYEYRQELSELPDGDSKERILKHLLVIEEAHRVLGKCNHTEFSKQKVSAMFSNMISEIGAYGQGIMIADQIPSRLNEDTVKNTNMKIVHRLVSADDRDAMATALNLWDRQTRIIGDLELGEVLVRGEMDKEAYCVKVNMHNHQACK